MGAADTGQPEHDYSGPLGRRQIRAVSWPDTLHKHTRLGHSGATRGKRDPVTGPLLAHLELLLLC